MVVQHGDVGGIDIVGPAHRRRAGDGGRESGEDPPARLDLPGDLRRPHDTGAVSDSRAIEPERLHHSVPVEPVVVAEAEPLVHRRPVAVERAPKPLRQTPFDPGIAGKSIRGGASPAEQHGVGREPRGKGGGPVAAAGLARDRTNETAPSRV